MNLPTVKGVVVSDDQQRSTGIVGMMEDGARAKGKNARRSLYPEDLISGSEIWLFATGVLRQEGQTGKLVRRC